MKSLISSFSYYTTCRLIYKKMSREIAMAVKGDKLGKVKVSPESNRIDEIGINEIDHFCDIPNTAD